MGEAKMSAEFQVFQVVNGRLVDIVSLCLQTKFAGLHHHRAGAATHVEQRSSGMAEAAYGKLDGGAMMLGDVGTCQLVLQHRMGDGMGIEIPGIELGSERARVGANQAAACALIKNQRAALIPVGDGAVHEAVGG